MAQDGLASFEPAYVDELAIILRWAFEHIQGPAGYGEDAGGSVYLRLSTRQVPQLPRKLRSAEIEGITAGAYWVRRPGPNAELVIAYTGTVAPEATLAVGLIAEDRRDVGLLAVTSADRLHRGWTAEARTSHIARLLVGLGRDCALVTVLDGHPATLGWLGSVHGHRTRALGVTRFGQTGTIAELYRAAGIDAQSIAAAAAAVAPGRPIRHLRTVYAS